MDEQNLPIGWTKIIGLLIKLPIGSYPYFSFSFRKISEFGLKWIARNVLDETHKRLRIIWYIYIYIFSVKEWQRWVRKCGGGETRDSRGKHGGRLMEKCTEGVHHHGHESGHWVHIWHSKKKMKKKCQTQNQSVCQCHIFCGKKPYKEMCWTILVKHNN